MTSWPTARRICASFRSPTRRARLEDFIARLNEPRVDLSPLVPFATWDDLTAARKDPAAAGAGVDAEAVEGIMLKRRDALYVPGRPKGPWWKWKRDPFIIDAVLMYAQRGHGKRSSYYSDYTFGVWTRGEDGDELVPVGKAYFGFTDEELLQIDRFVRRNTIDRFGPVREVVHEPDQGLVLEVAFEGLQRSTRHKSGLAMRFPRINRLRWDKPPGEADRLERLETMIARIETGARCRDRAVPSVIRRRHGSVAAASSDLAALLAIEQAVVHRRPSVAAELPPLSRLAERDASSSPRKAASSPAMRSSSTRRAPSWRGFIPSRSPPMSASGASGRFFWPRPRRRRSGDAAGRCASKCTSTIRGPLRATKNRVTGCSAGIATIMTITATRCASKSRSVRCRGDGRPSRRRATCTPRANRL